EAFVEASNDPSWLVVAHNDQFESAIEQHVLGPRHGFPRVPIDRHRCTMAMALAAALPGALENVAEVLALGLQKDREGAKIMRRLARRTQAEPNGAALEILYDSCRRDVDVERLVFNRLPPLSAQEQLLWELDQRINARGFSVDRALALAV